ncbi:hypothetical protein J437_LFUL011316 [Ladona fulva]|uniref:G-patch domain-containing protein n=1 Tax=Ladona fulva TaxID=123851 RepID=A0A8K0PAH2_LADFU|nr:hypothetical protein J437_LFUL011316 [Ladona fulva]
MEDGEYKPLNPMDIRLPPPAPPSERLLAAVEAFYGPPSHDRPRDSEGWEKLGLYEYYRAKNAARRKKEEDIRDGLRVASRSPSPIIRPRSRSKTPPPRKRYRRFVSFDLDLLEGSKSRSKSPQSDADVAVELKIPASPPAIIANSNALNSSAMSLPLLPRPGKGSQGPLLTAAEAAAVAAKTGNSPSKRNSGGSVTSPEQTASLSSNTRHRKKGSDIGPGRSRSRSRSLSPPSAPMTGKKSPERSPTPPSFLGSTYGGKGPERVLDESNKGHQMLRKMGWGGAGLGVKEQGIETPISGGEVRDRTDQYKGLGVNLNDPYENFRKSKGQAFINRMKARAEEWL